MKNRFDTRAGRASNGDMRYSAALVVACGSLLIASEVGHAQSAAPPTERLDAAAIYERALRNLMESAILDLRIRSVDPGGNEQRYEVEMMWRRYPEGTAEAREGILSRALARYLAPRDLRQSSALVINRRDQVDEQYLYLRSQQRVRRMNLSGQNVFGTDFAVGDVVPRGLSHASYQRVADEKVDDIPCFVVEALFKREAEASYSRGLFYVEQQHFVPLLVRYWDLSGVEVKALRTDRTAIREVEGLHVPTRLTVHSLQSESFTELSIAKLVANPAIPESYFSVRHLEAHATGGLPRHYYADAHEFGQE